MPRPMSGDMIAAFQASLLRPAIFVEATFATGTVYIWSGLGNVTWNSHTWVGVGSFGGISTTEEGSTVEAKGITLSLSGIDVGLLADVLQEFQIGAPVIVRLGLFDGAIPPALIASPIVSWSGQMDQPTIDVSGETATITINCENRLIEMNVPCDRRYTLDDASIDTPGDLALQFVAACSEINIYWGKSPATSTNL